jgi:hypothetical protein
MRTILHQRVMSLSMVALLGFGASLSAADVEAIIAPAKRADSLEKARQLLAQKAAPAQTADPFFPEAFEGVRNARPADEAVVQPDHSAGRAGPNSAPKGDHELLQSIANSLKPSGYFVLGGQPTLVFGQKRVKAGGLLTITFEGKEYTLEVTALNRTNFTLRLNREEFTRPIK